MTTTPCFGRHEFRATGTSKLAWNVQAREDSSKDSLSRLPTLSLADFAKIWSRVRVISWAPKGPRPRRD